MPAPSPSTPPCTASPAASFAALTAGRFLAALVLLVVPTSLMGLTLPLISASSVVRASFGSRMSLAYGINTAGGVAGAAVAGFVAIPAVGAQAAMHLAASVNIVVGLSACALSWHSEGGAVRRTNTAPAPGAGDARAAPSSRVLDAVVIGSGAAAMALEVLWFRALLQFFPATTYAFTTMLAVVLVGIAGGGLAASWWLNAGRDWRRWLPASSYATAVFVATSLAVLARTFASGWLPGGPVVASVIAMLPAALAMGAGLPVALKVGAAEAADVRAADVAGRVGRLYALNVSGGVAGALLAGFVLVPWLGVRSSLAIVTGVFGLCALLAAHLGGHPTPGRTVPAGLALLALALAIPDPLDAASAERHGADRAPLWRDEGPQATVSVHGSDRLRMLFIDGLPQASDAAETVAVHRTIGHLAMVLHPNPVDALVIGLGGGATAGAVSRHGARISIVELNDGVRRAAPWFRHINYDVLQQSSTHLVVDDARSFLATTDQRFDVITADIIQPTHAGAGNLYSREYFSRVRARLKPGGLVLQWVGLREESAYDLIARTFQSVFPDTTVWVHGTLLVGTLEPLRVSRQAVARHLARPETRDALAAIGLTSVDTLLSWYSGGPDDLRRFVGPGMVLTDDQPLVEFYRALPSGERLAPLADLHGDVAAIVVP